LLLRVDQARLLIQVTSIFNLLGDSEIPVFLIELVLKHIQ